MVRKVRNSWWVDFGFQGKRHRYRSPVNSKEGALQYEGNLRERLGRGDNIRARPLDDAFAPTFAAWVKEWEPKWVLRELKKSTIKGYQSVVRRYLLPRFGASTLDAITSSTLQDFKNALDAKGLSGKSINNALSVLRVILTSAHESSRLSQVPKFKWKKKTPRTIDWLPAEASDRLVAHVSQNHWRLMVLCALRTGMRFGELLGLRWTDVDFDQNRIHVKHNLVDGVDDVPKTGVYRQIPMTEDLRQALFSAPRRSSRVHVLPSGTTPTRTGAGEALQRAYRKAGLRHVHWHMLRHSFAMQLLASGVDLVTVRDLMGHTSIQTTMGYLHINMPRMEAAMRTLLQAEATRLGTLRHHSVYADTVQPP